MRREKGFSVVAQPLFLSRTATCISGWILSGGFASFVFFRPHNIFEDLAPVQSTAHQSSPYSSWCTDSDLPKRLWGDAANYDTLFYNLLYVESFKKFLRLFKRAIIWQKFRIWKRSKFLLILGYHQTELTSTIFNTANWTQVIKSTFAATQHAPLICAHQSWPC